MTDDYSSSVSMFTVTAGVWTPLAPATVATGQGPESLVVDPSNRFVYLVNNPGNQSKQDEVGTVSMFTINAGSGLLTPMTPATVPLGHFPQWIVVDPLDRFAYAANTGDMTSESTLSMFTINSTSGVLTPTSPATVVSNAFPVALTIDPTGRFVYAANQGTLIPGGHGAITMYTVNATTGVLAPMSPAAVTGVNVPYVPKVDPTGHFLYVPDNGQNQVAIFAIDQTTGMLTPAKVASVSVGLGPTSVGIDSTSSFVYVVNREAETISQFTRNPTDGSLTPMSTPTVASPGRPWQITIDPSGKFAYVSEQNLNVVRIFSIDAGGALTPSSTAPTGTNPGEIGIALKQ